MIKWRLSVEHENTFVQHTKIIISSFSSTHAFEAHSRFFVFIQDFFPWLHFQKKESINAEGWMKKLNCGHDKNDDWVGIWEYQAKAGVI